MVVRRTATAVTLAAFLICRPAWAATVKPEPSFMHGVGKLVDGVVFELPKTVIDATLTNPPVLGTLVGVFAGTALALQTTFAGLVEMSAAFKPFTSEPKR